MSNSFFSLLSSSNVVTDDVEIEVEVQETTEPDLDAMAQSTALTDRLCVECQDQRAMYNCQNCGEIYCEVCYESQHRKGKRMNHVKIKLECETSVDMPEIVSALGEKKEIEPDLGKDRAALIADVAKRNQFDLDSFLERAKWTPLRLSLENRKSMRLINATMDVSEYTDKVDIFSATQKSKRVRVQVKEVAAILIGLKLAENYQEGLQLLKEKEFKELAPWYQHIFEISRRHKIRNPEKMRASYGKMIYLLQDTHIPEVRELFEDTLIKPIKTVYNSLEVADALGLLSEDLLYTATQNISAEGKVRAVIDREIKVKEKSLEYLARKYTSAKLSYDDARNCILSIGDANSFLLFNRDPVIKMIDYLQIFFHPDNFESQFSLAIVAGHRGARLTHAHSTQYFYVLQSLTLWRFILQDMYKLWMLSEDDLLDPNNRYVLSDNGQGLNRVQNCPRVSKAIHSILVRCQREIGMNWVGSSVIHLGDRNVPNALMFIDKYNQVSRILQPICICLRRIDELCALKTDIRTYIQNTFGGAEKCKKTRLCDIFRSAFDGSGSDNFFEAGSCIDGRLTSAWNWCSLLEKKPFYYVFLLTGFVGFDGDWS